MQDKTNALRQVQVFKKRQEAEGVCSFELVCPSGQPLSAFTAGAHIDVHINGLVRQYSLCNDPAEATQYRIGVLREPASRGGSVAMHEALSEGDVLSISEPRNHFSLVEGDHHTVLLAGGIGITPLLGMARHLQRSQASFALHYCARSRERAAFLDEILASPFAGNVFFHPDDAQAEQRFDINQLLKNCPAGSHWYVCGPAGFLDYVLGHARTAGIPDCRLHREYFGAAPAELASKGGNSCDAFEVVIASTGEAYTIESDESITHGLLRQGIEIPVSCEQGVCGTCLTSVLEGTPDHRDLVLTAEEHARNDLFAPCCSRSKTARLVLDL
ncbi:MAG: oxidoreductase [Candidimonas sp.]|nr:oxidoreductase [Candidimonas sp.]